MRALALLMIVAITIPMAFVQPIVGLMLWIWFSYLNPHRIAYGFAVGAPWVMIVALVTLFSMAMHSRERQPMHMTTVTVLLLLFLFWTGVCTVFSVRPDLAYPYWIQFFKIQLMAFVTIMLVTDAQRMRWVIWTIVLSFGFWGLKGGVFTIISGGGYHVMGPDKSFFRDNNDFALVMCMTLPLMRYLQLSEPRRMVRQGLWALIGFTCVAIVGTYSRGGFLALAVVGFMLMLKSRRRAGLLVTVPMLVVAVGMFMPQQWYSRINSIDNYQQDKSAQGRLNSWKFATNVALADPLTGGGFRMYASESLWRQYGPEDAVHRAIHSIYFTVLGDNGFVGLALFLLLGTVGWFSLSRLRKQARAGPHVAWIGDLASMIQVSIAGFAAAGAFLPMSYFDLFYQLLAITVVLQLFMARELKKAPAREKNMTAATPPATVKPVTPVPSRGAVASASPRAKQASNQAGMRDLPWW